MSTLDKLRALGACKEALDWVASRPKKRQTLSALWADCSRGDWMLWLAARLGTPDVDGIQSAAWACAHLAQAYAAHAADAAAHAADAAANYADYAAYAAHAAAAHAAAAAAADYADYAAYYAARAAYYAAHADADAYAQRECADLVRLLVRRPHL